MWNIQIDGVVIVALACGLMLLGCAVAYLHSMVPRSDESTLRLKPEPCDGRPTARDVCPSGLVTSVVNTSE